MKYKQPLLLGAASLLAVAVHPPIAIAAEYLSVASAQREAFAHADTFKDITVTLAPAQQQAIASLAGPQPPHGKLTIWRASLHDMLLGYFFVDEVIGRQDFITYAASIDAAGKLGAVQILNYRESHGAEIRNTGWRKQFVGRDTLEQLRFAIDIKNIAGATLSCEHVTQGVRWLVALWQTALKDHAADPS